VAGDRGNRYHFCASSAKSMCDVAEHLSLGMPRVCPQILQ
jgi:hypothetical protein